MKRERYSSKHLMKKTFSRRIPALLLVLCMVLSCFCGVATLAEDQIEIDLEQGDYTITESGNYAANDYSGSNSIIIASDAGEVNLTISGLNITAANGPAICVQAGSILNLTVEGENSLTGSVGSAGICAEPAYDDDWTYLPDDSAVLNISGSGVLTATGGDGNNNCSSGAGIGGNGQNFDGEQGGVDFGTITVTEDFTGVINAFGGTAGRNQYNYGAGAGIGTGGANGQGYFWGEIYGQILLKSGTINAGGGKEPSVSSEAGGAGIGGGGAAGGNTLLSYIIIEISGGNVTAVGAASGAGIGGGGNCNSGVIKISGGYVKAYLEDYNSFFCGAAIGAGDNAAFTSIEITGGTVVADARNRSGAGIGYGTYGAFGILEDNDTIYITISGSNTTVYAYGGSYNNKRGSAGIGLGACEWPNEYDHDTVITIKEGATVYSYGGYHAQSIGYSYFDGKTDMYTGKGFELVLDDSITLWAVNADYNLPALVAYQQNAGVSPVDISHLKYVSTERYLITYTNYNETSPDLTSGTAIGTLAAPDDFATEYPKDAELTWELIGDQMKMVFTDPRVNDIEPLFYPFADDNAVGGSALHGNWATMYPPIVKVEYEFVGDAPDGVNPPDEEYIAKGDAYDAKAQEPSEKDGWIFDGWYTDPACTEESRYQDGTELNGDIVLYGKWTEAIPVGTLEISKIVEGDLGEHDRDFPFTVTFSDGKNYSYTKQTQNGDTETGTTENPILLKDGETVTIRDIPAGTLYTVTESDHDGYTVTISGSTEDGTGSIIAEETQTVRFTNTKNSPSEPDNPQTDDNGIGMWIALLTLSVFGILGLGIVPHKRKMKL